MYTSTPIKPMVYETKRKIDILAHGIYSGVPFWVVSRGTHPCVYVDATWFGDFDAGIIKCHGGITYDEHELPDICPKDPDSFYEKRFIGWDYAHGSDYVTMPTVRSSLIGSKKWTTEEMIEDAHEVIAQLCRETKIIPPKRSVPVTSDDYAELIREFFTEIVRGAEEEIREEIFENMDEELLKKYDIVKISEMLNFQAFADVIRLGVLAKYGVELDFD